MRLIFTQINEIEDFFLVENFYDCDFFFIFESLKNDSLKNLSKNLFDINFRSNLSIQKRRFEIIHHIFEKFSSFQIEWIKYHPKTMRKS